MNAMAARNGSNDIPEVGFPAVCYRELDHVALLDWARDLRSHGRIEEVRVKRGGAELQSAAGQVFSVVFGELILHHLTAVQVRYVYGGQTYFDTCFSECGAFRLVRLQLHSG